MSNPRLPRDHWRVEPAKVTDTAFIIDSWCADESVRVSRLSGEDPDVFKVGQRARILRLLSTCPCAAIRPTKAWFDAQGLPHDPRVLFGWACYTSERTTLRPIVHFVYVKGDFRGQGLADALLYAAGVRPDKGAWSTHHRQYLRKAVASRGIVYNRYLLDYDPAAKPPIDDPYGRPRTRT